MEKEVITRDALSLQTFMDEMKKLGKDVNDRELIKPNWNYGSLEITNYLLWLILGELTMVNNKIEEEEEYEVSVEEEDA